MSSCPFPTTITIAPRTPPSINECPGYETEPSDDDPLVWGFGECKVLLHCHYFQVHSDLEVFLPVRVPSMTRIDLFN